MAYYALPILFALGIWWSSTMLIIWAYSRPQRTWRASFTIASALGLVMVWGVWATRTDTSMSGAYWAFTCGMLLWGWHVLAFYTGFLAGPRRTACAPGCHGLRHVGHAIQTSVYHELAVMITAAGLVLLTWYQGNQVALWTFVLLWWMHDSARLNIFCGVRNFNGDLLPNHLQFLRCFFRYRRMTPFFVSSMAVSAIFTLFLVGRATVASTPFEAVSFTLFGSLMLLAILEHAILMLPAPRSLQRPHGRKPLPVEVEAVAHWFQSSDRNTRETPP